MPLALQPRPEQQALDVPQSGVALDQWHHAGTELPVVEPGHRRCAAPMTAERLERRAHVEIPRRAAGCAHRAPPRDETDPLVALAALEHGAEVSEVASVFDRRLARQRTQRRLVRAAGKRAI